jgi:hypothetical protein
MVKEPKEINKNFSNKEGRGEFFFQNMEEKMWIEGKGGECSQNEL